ncbi:MAG: hypothetical protein Kow00128_11840 [Deltaproteobacteria bacterium]
MRRAWDVTEFVFMLMLAMTIFLGRESYADVYYADNGLLSNCIGTYNPSTRVCSGGTSTAYITIQAAVNASNADNVIVRAGNYPERVTTARNGQYIRADGYVYMRGFSIVHDGCTVDGFDISGNIATANPSTNAGVWIDADNVTVINNSVHDLCGGVYGVNNCIGIYTQYSIPNYRRNAVIRKNHVYNIKNVNVQVSGYNHLVENNEIGPGVDTNDAFRLLGNGHILRGNYVHDLGWKTVDPHIDFVQCYGDNSDDCLNFLIEKNFITNCNDSQLFFLSSDGNRFDNVIFRNNIWMNQKDAGQSFGKIYFYNNTIYNVGSHNCRAIMLRKGIPGDASGSIIKNNIFAKTGCSANNGYYVVQDAGIVNTVIDRNLVWQDTNMSSAPKSAFSEAHGINGFDPKFVSQSPMNGNDFRLSYGSPAIDAGEPIFGFSDDFSGVGRPQGISWDIGAHEAVLGGPMPQGPMPPTNLSVQ